MTPQTLITAATTDDIPQLAPLFGAYREFYGEQADAKAVDAFLHRQLGEDRTRFFLAKRDGGVAGFVHLLPSVNTLAMRPMWFLEDLYVTLAARRSGVAAALMAHAAKYARSSGAERLTLATACDNGAAQALYLKLGYTRERHFWYYHLLLPGTGGDEGQT